MTTLIRLTPEQVTFAERCIRIRWALVAQHTFEFPRPQARRLAWLRWCVQAGARNDSAWWTWPQRAQEERER